MADLVLHILSHFQLLSYRTFPYRYSLAYPAETSPEIYFLQPLTSDQSKLLQEVRDLYLDPKYSANGLSGVLDALTELSGSSNKGSVIQSIVFVTSGISDLRPREEVITRAQSLNIPIHTILVRRDALGGYVNPLQEIADGTGGFYTHYIRHIFKL